jgi:outer membrane lipoprotein-sorting protein
MFSSNPPKLFCLALFFSICFSSAASCGLWGRANENSGGGNPANFAAQEIPSEIPFPNKEPDVFQTEIIVSTFTNNGEKSERKTFIARSGNRRVTVFDAGEKNEISLLQLDQTGVFSIYREKKIYTEKLASQSAAAGSSAESFSDFLTAARLNAKATAGFERLGAENGLRKFRARLNNSEASEILIYVDENLKLPVRQEFYSRAGEQKTLLYTIELKNFQLQTDEKLFEPPSVSLKDFRKVSLEEFEKILWQE